MEVELLDPYIHDGEMLTVTNVVCLHPNEGTRYVAGQIEGIQNNGAVGEIEEITDENRNKDEKIFFIKGSTPVIVPVPSSMKPNQIIIIKNKFIKRKDPNRENEKEQSKKVKLN